MRSKGFTLIELLAVIVILAIIALIAVPIVLNIIDNSKKESVKVSAEHYFDAVEQAVAKEYLKDSKAKLDGKYDIDEKSKGKKIIPKEVEEETPREIDIEYDGEAIDGGTIEIKDGKVKQAENVKINNYYATLESGKITLSKKPKEKPGLYKPDGTFISWDDLTKGDNPIIIVTDGVIGQISSENITNLNGRLVISEGVTSIGDSAFRDCSSLTRVTIPNSVTSIGTYAFYGCSSLTRVTIPNSVTSIGNYSFRNCSNLTEVIIPESVTSIGTYAFYGCSSLTSVTIPNSVTSIGNYAFTGCTNLTSINVEENNLNYSSDNGILYNKEKTSLKRYPEGKKESIFIIPSSVTSIGISAFQNCTNLIEVTIPSSVTSIGTSAFASCTNLASITIPEGVTSIGASAFKECSLLRSIYIPLSVKRITGLAFSAPFYSCSSDLVIYCGASTKPSMWLASWNNYSTSGKLEVRWGYTKEQYEEEINALSNIQ